MAFKHYKSLTPGGDKYCINGMREIEIAAKGRLGMCTAFPH